VIVTAIVSFFGTPKPDSELDGLVYGATKIPKQPPVPFYKNEWCWTALAIVVFVTLNIIFW
jgi:SSS family solute:Na+ symporter